ncbi:MAG: sigma-70 family RNA polymerase sigma factor [Phycisphaeraceae bacterium]|nr:sigma-70 family RNA polymerase sigma factor [Phycisphaeraceae bacterium]
MTVVPEGKNLPHLPQPDSDGVNITPVLFAAARGDETAWRQIVDLYARRVFALAQARLRNPDVAEEIAQSVFATLAAKLVGGGYTERGKFEPWLFRIASNRIRDEQRRNRRHPTTHDSERIARTENSEEPASAPPEQVRRLRWAMGQLGDSDREVIELRHHGQMSFGQMAEVLGEPLGTLLARHHRALAKLKALMDQSMQSDSSGVRAGGRLEA